MFAHTAMDLAATAADLAATPPPPTVKKCGDRLVSNYKTNTALSLAKFIIQK
jgi:hypothetical protein